MSGKGSDRKLHDQKGAAMVVVLCIMAVLLVLSLTILLSGASLVGSAKKNRTATNCRIMAESFQDLLDKEITGKTVDVNGFPNKNSDGKSQPIYYFAMRSLREQVERGVSAEADNLIKIKGTSEDADEFRIYYGDGEPYNESGYQMKMKIYLEAKEDVLAYNFSEISGKYAKGKSGPLQDSVFSDKYLDYYPALIYGDGGIDGIPDSDAEVRLHTKLTCSKGNETYTISSAYKVKINAILNNIFILKIDDEGNAETDEDGKLQYTENPPVIKWTWEKV